MPDLVCLLLDAYWWVLVAFVVLSWVPRPPEPFLPVVRVVRLLVDPVVGPLRKVLPPLQMGNVALDLSILVVFFGIVILRSAVC